MEVPFSRSSLGAGAAVGRCAELLRAGTGAAGVLMTSSCTSALEVAALLSDVGPGDEVVMPSWTYVATANAFVLRGAMPVWADVEPGTLNLDPASLSAALTERTRAVVVVHYAGIAADMRAIGAIAAERELFVVEDAAHAIGAALGGRALGTFGDVGALSFHHTKNVTCGEGGALLVRDGGLFARAEIVHDSGTDRAAFQRGDVPAYAWQEPGLHPALGELPAQHLVGELERVDAITEDRRRVWRAYEAAFGDHDVARVPEGAEHNAHIFWLRQADRGARDRLIAHAAARGVDLRFHYTPLHVSPAGRRLGRAGGPLGVTEAAAEGLVRLPLWEGMGDDDVERVVDAVSTGL
ncbi:MAG TPA: dTDP-4-amino-4,6-dideoxygalactose transaminase [Solirubrobacteraceae bacterium]|jgi:dTDP-4-amino-4,6-dideoxygalactose transaminase